ncbi:membrane protein insertase YidC [Thiomicrorhabdus xiamenensis]|uniref:Membrane protein insertase YidC n=1 Tax=Thiomicrorhabdus xiamenensis TaxID=2739063 RepID=A0A7D4NQ74_9GAMM|nr:membrane protein insertase YidC [Thiomicrorhabdus xiamenensis]QKI90233.1 membrane protein insertase YidC [Thiomicrorhabdus xiamenensis]
MNMRSFWWLALAFTLTWIWLEWMQFSAQKEQVNLQTSTAQEVPLASDNASVAPADTSVPGANIGSVSNGAVPVVQDGIVSAQRITVKTDTLQLVIDTQGGDIRDAKLLQYGATKDHSQPFHLMSDQGPLIYMAQNGLATSNSAKLPAPTHKDVWTAAKSEYVMNGDTLDVPLTWEKDGIKVTKTYKFTKGRYLIDVVYQVENQASENWTGSLYSQLVRNSHNPEENFMMYTYTGPVLYDGNAEEKYVKHSFDDLNTQSVTGQNVTGGWAAMIQQYFLSAIVPNQDEQNRYFAKPVGDGRYAVGVVEPLVEVPAGASGELSSQLYIGPEKQDVLAEIAPGLELTIDYGVLTFLAEPLFWILDAIHGFVGNWGVAIIMLTILIKLVFYKLSETSYRSMARLRKFQPKLQQLKENYGDDKAIFQQKLMKLYKEEKINPLGGCLPILIQMPVFIALYWVLLYSVEMRQAPFMLWIQDLSAQDPYYILPIIMGITMFIQQKLNPSAMMDEMQQKVMKLLPFIFTFFFLWFPAGLVLYWVVNNILSVAQQWYITKKIEAGEESK